MEIQEKLLSSSTIKSQYIGTIPLLVVMIVFLFGLTDFEYNDLLTFTGVVSIYFYPWAIALILLWSVYIMIWSRKLKKYIENKEVMLIPSMKYAKIRAGTYWTMVCMTIFIMIIAFVGDAIMISPFILIILLPTVLPVVIVLGLKISSKKAI